MPKRKVIQIEDDEWVIIDWIGQHEECCGCGMRHVVDYRVKDGQLQFRAHNKGGTKR